MWIIQAQSNQIFFSLDNNGMHLNVVNTNNLVKDETSYDKDARIYLAKVSWINKEKMIPELESVNGLFTE